MSTGFDVFCRSSTMRFSRSRTALAFAVCYRSLSSSSSALNIVVITGTTRTEGPPRPILGPRVSQYISSSLERRGHQVTVLDPRESGLPLLQKPHFAYAKSKVPPELHDLHAVLEAADAYVAVTPEYNHAPSPGLLNVLNHFGSSTFGFKPSAIVSYSAGQWGGTRAAQALRPILSELGCLPVSAMIHVPFAQDTFGDDGSVQGEEEEKQQWDGYVDRCFSQLEWWGNAARKHRDQVDPTVSSPPFRQTPSQRNAPS